MTAEEVKREKARERVRLWRINNPDGWKNYYSKNKEKLKQKAKKRYWENYENSIEISRRYDRNHRKQRLESAFIRYRNKPHYAETQKRKEFRKTDEFKRLKKEDNIKRVLLWQKVNPEKANLKNAMRKSMKMNATPPWVNKSDLLKFYEAAKVKEKETGIKYHVDHIWPLKHNRFCGLNVPWNLQILTASENCSKNNRAPNDLR